MTEAGDKCEKKINELVGDFQVTNLSTSHYLLRLWRLAHWSSRFLISLPVHTRWNIVWDQDPFHSPLNESTYFSKEMQHLKSQTSPLVSTTHLACCPLCAIKNDIWMNALFIKSTKRMNLIYVILFTFFCSPKVCDVCQFGNPIFEILGVKWIHGLTVRFSSNFSF